jgi:hypothetical protein
MNTKFVIGQPVVIRWSRYACNVIGIEDEGPARCYRLKTHEGREIVEIEDLISRMKPIESEKTRDGRIRTKPGYFFSIRGGLA